MAGVIPDFANLSWRSVRHATQDPVRQMTTPGLRDMLWLKLRVYKSRDEQPDAVTTQMIHELMYRLVTNSKGYELTSKMGDVLQLLVDVIPNDQMLGLLTKLGENMSKDARLPDSIAGLIMEVVGKANG